MRDHGLLGANALADAIRGCHAGLLCSAFGEGSPFIVIEALAAGRPFALPPLQTLVEAYGATLGAHIVVDRTADDFLGALEGVRADMLGKQVDPFAISAGVAERAQTRAVPKLLADLARLSDPEAPDQSAAPTKAGLEQC